jgi:hypothetical protein
MPFFRLQGGYWLGLALLLLAPPTHAESGLEFLITADAGILQLTDNPQTLSDNLTRDLEERSSNYYGLSWELRFPIVKNSKHLLSAGAGWMYREHDVTEAVSGASGAAEIRAPYAKLSYWYDGGGAFLPFVTLGWGIADWRLPSTASTANGELSEADPFLIAGLGGEWRVARYLGLRAQLTGTASGGNTGTGRDFDFSAWGVMFSAVIRFGS